MGNDLDAVPIYNDLGSNIGGIYHTNKVREMVIPYVREFFEHVNRVSEYHIIFHSCGSIYQYIPDLIDAGVRILNPVQIGARNMEAEKLKREFGRDIVFWDGAVNPQQVLAFGTPEQIKGEARNNIEEFKKGGGFVFANVYNVQAIVKPENVVALYDAAYDFGGY